MVNFFTDISGESFKILRSLTFQIPAVAAAFSFFLISMTSLKFAFHEMPLGSREKNIIYISQLSLEGKDVFSC